CPDGELGTLPNSEEYIPAMRGSLLRNGLPQTVGCQREQALVPFVQMPDMGEIDATQCECEQSGEVAGVTAHLENGYSHGLFCKPPVTRPQCHDGTADFAVGQIGMQLRMLGCEHGSCPLACLRAQARIVDPSAHCLSIEGELVPDRHIVVAPPQNARIR